MSEARAAEASPERSGRRAMFGFLATFLLLGAVALGMVYGLRLNSPVIRSDGVGYYLYLPAIVIYRDPGLSKLAEDVFRGRIPQWSGAIPLENSDEYVIRYPIGEAILLLPFFLVACLTALLADAPLQGFSWPFQLLAAISGLTYSALGITLLWRTMERWFRDRSIAIAMIGVVYGTNLFHYATYDNIFSHTYSFFLCGAFLACAQAIFLDARVRMLVLLGVIAGMLTITRPTNLLWTVAGLGLGLTSASAVTERLKFMGRHGLHVLAAVVAFSAVIAIQLAYWKTVTGHAVIYTYGQYGFNFSSPEIWNVLFSVRKGLFFWAPLWLAVLPGAWLLARRAGALAPGLLAFLLAHIYVVSSWWNWWYGGSFGQRPFVEATPVLAMCLAALYEDSAERGYRPLLLTVGGLCVVWSLWLMAKYWTGVIPFDGTTWAHFTSTFFQLSR